MAISFIGVATAANALVGGTSVTLNTPGGTVNGDMMIAHVCLEAVGRTMTPPAGWTQLAVSVNESDHTHRIFWKIANAEPGSRNWSWTGGATAFTGILTSYRGVANIHGNTNVDGLTLLVHPGPIVPVFSDGAWLEVSSSGMSLLALGWAPPAGMTERADVIGGLLVLLNVNTCLDTQGPVGSGNYQRSTVSLDLVAAINSLIILEPLIDITASENRMRYTTPFGILTDMGIMSDTTLTGVDGEPYGYDSGGVLIRQQRSLPLAAGESCC